VKKEQNPNTRMRTAVSLALTTSYIFIKLRIT
jgi:hypothetical protein